MKNIVIVDIDGTISEVGDRIKYLQQHPKNWDAFYNDCFDDKPIIEIIDLVYNLYLSRYNIIFCTGRRESCREKTIKWFNKYFEPEIAKNCHILMRKDNDRREDKIIKPLLLKEFGIDFDSIAFVIEDRDSVVEMWRSRGLICLQPRRGEF